MTNNASYSLLVIDDDPKYFDHFFSLSPHFASYPAESIEKAIDQLNANPVFDAILLDLAFSKNGNFHEGLEMLPELLKKTTIPIIIVSYDDRWETYRTALNYGAAGYLFKRKYPENIGLWQRYIERTIQKFSVASKFSGHFSKIAPKHYRHIMDAFACLCNYKVPIVLQGEPGIGKGLIVQRMWKESFGKDNEISEINLNRNVEKTLDEILSLCSTNNIVYWTGLEGVDYKRQSELLSLFLRKEYENYPRWIFASSITLNRLREENKLMSSLHRFFHSFTLEINPLRKRKSEFKKWIELFLKHPSICPIGCRFFEEPLKDVFRPEAIEALKKYDWPENIRELRAVIQVVIATAEAENKKRIDLDCLPDRIKIMSSSFKTVPTWPPKKQAAYEELMNIQQALIEASHKEKEAAKQLGLGGEMVLKRKVKEIHLTYPDLFDPDLCKRYELEYGYEKTINTLICLAPQNAEMLENLMKHLNPIVQRYPIRISNNINYLPGAMKEEVLINELKQAELIILMICKDFFTCEELVKVDLLSKIHILKENAKIILIITQPSTWKLHKLLSEFPFYPNGEKAVSLWNSPDDAFVEVVEGIKQDLDMMKTQ